MAKLISKTYNLEVWAPKKEDLTKQEKTELKVLSKLNIEKNTMEFSCKLPEHVFDYLKDSEENYSTNPLEPEHYYESKKKPWKNILKATSLLHLLEEYRSYCNEASSLKEHDDAVVTKHIAIKFNNSCSIKKDMFNFASMGKLTYSSFQFFICYKDESKSGFERRVWKSDVHVGEQRYGRKGRSWFYYDSNTLSSFKIVKWTQEREDFLQKIQDKLNSVNDELSKYLSDLDENKLEVLMEKSEFLKLGV